MAQTQTKYQKGDMKRDLWQKAIRRWKTNQEKRTKMETLKNAPRLDVITQSQKVTGGYREQSSKKSIALSNAGTRSASGTRGQENQPVLNVLPYGTLDENASLCTFCFEPVPNPNLQKMYCGTECRRDAYLVRKAFKDGVARPYWKALLSRNEVK